VNNACSTTESALPEENDFGQRVIDQLRTVYDPEIPVNIYDLGLIYDITIAPNGKVFDVKIDMTLTSPNCPIAEHMPILAQRAVEELEEAKEVMVNLVWDPPWDKSRMTDEARMQLDMF
jgi:FeS assembly SUF system protein